MKLGLGLTTNGRVRAGRLAGIGVGALALAPTLLYAQAGPLQYVPLPAVFQTSTAACEALQAATPNGLIDVPGVDAGAAAVTPAEGALSSGLCLYQLLRTGTDRQGLLEAASDFQKAQTLGLTRSEQATATILEGLAECQLAALELNPNGVVSPPSSPPGPPAQTPLFCAARQTALASFSKVRLADLHVTFPASTGLSPDSLTQALMACYDTTSSIKGPLNTSWAPQCGIYVANSDTIRSAVAAAHGAIASRYFVGGAAPLSAMFARKKKLADSTLNTSLARKDAMLADSTNRIFPSYQNELAAVTQVETLLSGTPDANGNAQGGLIANYELTYARATAVQTRLDSWVTGLFRDDTQAVIRDYGADISSQTGQIAQMFTAPTGFANPQTGAAAVVNNAIAALNARATSNSQAYLNAQMLCKAFYCEDAYKDVKFGTSNYTKVCNAISGQTNQIALPLCSVPATKSIGAAGQQFALADFCAAAWANDPNGANDPNLDKTKMPEYLGASATGMSSAARSICWSSQ